MSVAAFAGVLSVRGGRAPFSSWFTAAMSGIQPNGLPRSNVSHSVTPSAKTSDSKDLSSFFSTSGAVHATVMPVLEEPPGGCHTPATRTRAAAPAPTAERTAAAECAPAGAAASCGACLVTSRRHIHLEALSVMRVRTVTASSALPSASSAAASVSSASSVLACVPPNAASKPSTASRASDTASASRARKLTKHHPSKVAHDRERGRVRVA